MHMIITRTTDVSELYDMIEVLQQEKQDLIGQLAIVRSESRLVCDQRDTLEAQQLDLLEALKTITLVADVPQVALASVKERALCDIRQLADEALGEGRS